MSPHRKYSKIRFDSWLGFPPVESRSVSVCGVWKVIWCSYAREWFIHESSGPGSYTLVVQTSFRVTIVTIHTFDFEIVLSDCDSWKCRLFLRRPPSKRRWATLSERTGTTGKSTKKSSPKTSWSCSPTCSSLLPTTLDDGPLARGNFHVDNGLCTIPRSFFMQMIFVLLPSCKSFIFRTES